MSVKQLSKKALLTGCVCAAGAEILHGMSYAFTKQSTNTAGVFFILGWRFLIAAAVMTVCIAAGLIKVRFRGKPLKPLLQVILLCPCVYFLGETLGISRTTSTECGIFVASIPVISLVASAVLLKNRPSGIQVAGIVTTLVGMVTCVTAVGMTSSLSVPGYIFLSVAVLSYSLYFICVEKASAYTSAELAYAMQISGAALFTALALIEALHDGNVGTLVALPFRDRPFLIAVLYLGIGCSVFAFWLSNAAIEKLGVNRAASFIGVATLVSVLTGTLMLREPLTPVQIVGAVLIVLGVYMANAGRTR
ncbi:MAG: DMT family transporter [Lentisphaeria bacterium]|jgi:drug/metabolite transporter (DMT)-like permease|nr:DMT family transporter [Lentisphaeria bacterium]